jgi:hypothetical protein
MNESSARREVGRAVERKFDVVGAAYEVMVDGVALLHPGAQVSECRLLHPVVP